MRRLSSKEVASAIDVLSGSDQETDSWVFQGACAAISCAASSVFDFGYVQSVIDLGSISATCREWSTGARTELNGRKDAQYEKDWEIYLFEQHLRQQDWEDYLREPTRT